MRLPLIQKAGGLCAVRLRPMLMFADKPEILVLSKCDTAPADYLDEVRDALQAEGAANPVYVFCQRRGHRGVACRSRDDYWCWQRQSGLMLVLWPDAT